MASAPAPTPALQTQRNLLASFTRVSKGLSLLLALGFVLASFSPSFVNYFALVPGRTIPFAWNLLTCAFVETNIIYLLIDVAALLFVGRLLEPVWGTKEFIRFVVVVSSSTACATFLVIYIAYLFTLKGKLLYTPISGFHCVVAGMLVALKQAMPEQEMTPLPLRVKWLPSLVVLLALLRPAVLGHGLAHALFVFFGAYSGWLYLRLFQARGAPDAALRGDPSDEFAFATFFPEQLRPFVAPVAAILGRIFCGRRQQGPAGAAEAAAGMPLPGSHPVEASRRRERGARALEERLSKASDASPSAASEKIPAAPLPDVKAGESEPTGAANV